MTATLAPTTAAALIVVTGAAIWCLLEWAHRRVRAINRDAIVHGRAAEGRSDEMGEGR